MKIISEHRCVIGEGPIWHAKERRLYFVNALERELCMLDIESGALEIRRTPVPVAAVAFDAAGGLLISTRSGAFRLADDDTMTPLYDPEAVSILGGNDMKVGPDGALYIGTQSEKRLGVSDRVNGRLYRISPNREVRVVLDGMRLSNGLDWSMDEQRLYHTDSETGHIREYDFDRATGNVAFTGREVRVPGVDGFTVDREDRLLVACWGHSRIAVVDTASMQIVDELPLPARAPASCGFAGEQMDHLVIVTATCNLKPGDEMHAGKTFLTNMRVPGRLPYLFQAQGQ